jgi:hypothetical protein
MLKIEKSNSKVAELTGVQLHPENIRKVDMPEVLLIP